MAKSTIRTESYQNKYDLTGLGFGDLTVIEMDRDALQLRSVRINKLLATCICICGVECKKSVYELLYAGVTTCHQCTRKKLNQLSKESRLPILHTYLSSIKGGARRRNLAFMVSEEYVQSIFTGYCALTGIPIEIPDRQVTGHGTASLDRIDSSQGYIEGNIQWIYKPLNFMKQDMDETEFIGLCKQVAAYR